MDNAPFAQPDIDAHAALGDGRSVALVGPDGCIDWWATPRLDATPLICALLDPHHGGCFSLTVREEIERTRRYLPATNILVTEVSAVAGRVRITESLNSGVAGRLPWTELARRVEGLEGEAILDWSFQPGHGLAAWSPWTEQVEDYHVVHAGQLVAGLVGSDAIVVERSHQELRGSFAVAAGDREVLALLVTDDEPVFLADWQDVDRRIELSAEAWRLWSDQIGLGGEFHEQALRSALALKLLVMSPTGAIAAAATTSLPERVGGDKNWDYRLAWIRDASLTVDALVTAGIREEVHAAVSWLLRAVRTADLQIFYTLDGAEPGPEYCADVTGYRDSGPVRIGNGAGGQRQHGIYGDLFGTVVAWVDDGHVLDVATRRQLADLADRAADVWRLTDSGLWELPEQQHYTISKIGAWRALRCASILSERGLIVGRSDRWQREAEQVRAFIETECWSERQNAYAMFAGSDRLDASLLLASRYEFDTGPRMRSTLEGIVRELGAGEGLLHRYSGVSEEESCFLACSYWMAEALARTGEVAEAADLLRTLAKVAPNDLGLMAEMRTPGGGPMTGNFPQALSHLAHINAICAVNSRLGTAVPTR